MDLLGLPWPTSLAFWLMIPTVILVLWWAMAYNPTDEEVEFQESGSSGAEGR